MPPPTSPAAPAASKPACRVCGSTAVTHEGSKRGGFIPRDFSFYQCCDCSFLFVEPVTPYSIYDDAYYAGRGPDPLVNYEEEYSEYRATSRRFEFEDLARLAQEHFGRLPGGAWPADRSINWLDFGCGAGGLLKYLRDLRTLSCRGTEVPVHPVGHDIGSYSRRLSQEDGFEILGWDDLNKTGNRFDIITCIEVIEHVADPAPVIRLLADCLGPGGLLILTTGNLDCLLAKMQGIDFAYCIPEIHISLFNPSLLRKLYWENGLTPVTFRYKGMIKFRVLKTLRLFSSGTSLTWLADLPPVLRLLDWIFGVSAMPCAVKPPSGGKDE